MAGSMGGSVGGSASRLSVDVAAASGRVALVAPSSPGRLSKDTGKLSPGSPLRATDDMAFSSATEYNSTFRGAPIQTHNSATTKRGNNSAALWLAIGEDHYSTETTTKFPGHLPPPPAARVVPKYERSVLPFHDATTYRTAFAGTDGGRPEIHKPKTQTATLPMPLASATEYSASYHPRASSPTKPVTKTEWRAAPKPFYGLTNYGESYTGTGVAPAGGAGGGGERETFAATVAKSPLMASSGTLRGTATAGSPGKGKFGATATTGSPGKHRVVTTSYGDLDGTGADPWKLMRKLGYEVGSRGSSAASQTRPAPH